MLGSVDGMDALDGMDVATGVATRDVHSAMRWRTAAVPGRDRAGASSLRPFAAARLELVQALPGW
jgi:hypothetical protein